MYCIGKTEAREANSGTDDSCEKLREPRKQRVHPVASHAVHLLSRNLPKRHALDPTAKQIKVRVDR